MQIIVQRGEDDGAAILGSMQIGELQLYTLEPSASRGAGFPMPAGTYPVTLETSPRFQMVTPHLQNVPGHSFIEIHPGNDAKDTEDCVLVGDTETPAQDWIGSSRDAFQKLMAVLNTDPENITITILEAPCA